MPVLLHQTAVEEPATAFEEARRPVLQNPATIEPPATPFEQLRKAIKAFQNPIEQL